MCSLWVWCPSSWTLISGLTFSSLYLPQVSLSRVLSVVHRKDLSPDFCLLFRTLNHELQYKDPLPYGVSVPTNKRVDVWLRCLYESPTHRPSPTTLHTRTPLSPLGLPSYPNRRVQDTDTNDPPSPSQNFPRRLENLFEEGLVFTTLRLVLEAEFKWSPLQSSFITYSVPNSLTWNTRISIYGIGLRHRRNDF